MAERSWLPGTSRTGTPASATRSSGASASWTSEAGTRLRNSRSPPWTTASTSLRSAGSSARSKQAKKSGPRRRRSTRGCAGKSKPRWVSETKRMRTSVTPSAARRASGGGTSERACRDAARSPRGRLPASAAPSSARAGGRTRPRRRLACRSPGARAWPGGTGSGAPGSRNPRSAITPRSRTSSRLSPSAGPQASEHSARHVSQRARRTACAARRTVSSSPSRTRSASHAGRVASGSAGSSTASSSRRAAQRRAPSRSSARAPVSFPCAAAKPARPASNSSGPGAHEGSTPSARARRGRDATRGFSSSARSAASASKGALEPRGPTACSESGHGRSSPSPAVAKNTPRPLAASATL